MRKIAASRYRAILWNSIMVAFVVGTVLNAINQGGEILAGGKVIWTQAALNYFVPFCVSAYCSIKSYSAKLLEPIMEDAVLESLLTCPHCGFARMETMPTDACLFYYECTHCKAMLRPKPGDCCVFCSYGSVKCPPIQAQRGCGGVAL